MSFTDYHIHDYGDRTSEQRCGSCGQLCLQVTGGIEGCHDCLRARQDATSYYGLCRSCDLLTHPTPCECEAHR